MNKTININIGERSFSITEEAYNLLHTYITNIKEYFKATSPENFQEIVDDFEFRIAELFSELVNSSEDKVVTRFHVAQVMEQLGNVNDFADDENKENTNINVNKANTVNSKSSRRLYRDTNNALLGGVLAGFAAFMGIDKTWVRLIFILIHFIPYLNYCPFLLIYLVMWLIVPPARNVIEQMRMRGEDLSADSIARNVINDGSNEAVSDTARLIFRAIFFILLIPIVLIVIAFALVVLGIMSIGLAPVMLFFESINFPEELFWGAPLALLAILLIMVIILVMVRMIYKRRIMHLVYLLLALFLVLGGSMLYVHNRMSNMEEVPYIVRGAFKNHPKVVDKTAYLNVVGRDTVAFTLKASEGYEQSGTYSIQNKMAKIWSLLGGVVTDIYMLTAERVDTDDNIFEYGYVYEPWHHTDGWFGYLGAIDWKSPDARACIKPNPDGTFAFVGCKPNSTAANPVVTLKYANKTTLKCVEVDFYIEIVK